MPSINTAISEMIEKYEKLPACKFYQRSENFTIIVNRAR